MKKTYIILDETNSLVKIGESENPEERLKQIQTTSPHKIKLISTTKEKERVLHSRFSRYRKHGEWFEYSREIRDFVRITDEEREKERKREAERYEREWKETIKRNYVETKKRIPIVIKEAGEYLTYLKEEFPHGWKKLEKWRKRDERGRKWNKEWGMNFWVGLDKSKDEDSFYPPHDDKYYPHGKYCIFWRGHLLITMGVLGEHSGDYTATCKAKLRIVFSQPRRQHGFWVREKYEWMSPNCSVILKK